MTASNVQQKVRELFFKHAPTSCAASMRLVCERDEYLSVRRDVQEPLVSGADLGLMITVWNNHGAGYSATSDLTEHGIQEAFQRALRWMKLSQNYPLFDYSKSRGFQGTGRYQSQVREPWSARSLKDKFDLLREINSLLRTDSRIVDWYGSLNHFDYNTYFLTTTDTEITQSFSSCAATMGVVANHGTETQKRTFEGYSLTRQGGLELLADVGFRANAERITAEALALLDALNCPTGKGDLLVDSSQMVLQIHESIGHPLELDRILGDERNYAGLSFVTPEMFGTYQYGSELLNVTFDPTLPQQLASYNYDDEGFEARREYLIEQGILKRGLGSGISQARSGLPGVACSRACSWNRPPIDRMANVNLEPGNSSLEEMVRAVEHGVLVKTNLSWSIDDSRNKFQFGCEIGWLIENGELTTLVKNPNYRGISATFWRNLKMVGDASTFKVYGVPNCGKGEPNQVARVGHATPSCLFTDVEIFGGT